MSAPAIISAKETRQRWILFGAVQLVAIALILGAFLLRHVIDRVSNDSGEHISTCIMHTLLHIYCPLCGGTRAMVALCRGQLWLSLQYNPVTAYLAGGFLVFDTIAAVRIARRHPTPLHIPRWYWIVGILLAALVFIIRNTALILFGQDNLGDLLPYWQG